MYTTIMAFKSKTIPSLLKNTVMIKKFCITHNKKYTVLPIV